MVLRIVSLRLSTAHQQLYNCSYTKSSKIHSHFTSHLVQSSSNELPCLDDFSSLYSPSRPPRLPLRATLPALSSAESPTSAAAASSRTKSPPSVCSRREHHAVPASITRPAARHVRQGTRAQTVRTAFHAERGRTLNPARRNVRSVHTERSRAVSKYQYDSIGSWTDWSRRSQNKPQNT
jgi:hypothetical protein